MKNITFHSGGVSLSDHASLMGQRGAVLWFTGLSGSGKSTVACETEKMLYEAGYKTVILDGDNLRFGLNADLGFSERDRDENIRRISETAKLMAEAGLAVLVSAVSPYVKQRENARKTVGISAAFVEIFVDAPIEVCAGRDPKGLYKKAYAGEIEDFTGVSAPYEAPEKPDIHLRTAENSVYDCAKKVFDYFSFIQDAARVTDFMVKTAIAAGEKIIEIYNRGFSVEYKPDNSPVTEADKTADRYINGEIAREFPGCARLTEESIDDRTRLENDYCFIVDPLDGTKEFVSRNGEFTVNIGLAHSGRTIAGVVYVPVTGALYYAFTGRGSFGTSSKTDFKLFDDNDRLFVSEKTEKITVLRSRSAFDDKTREIIEKNSDRVGETVPIGSSIKGCLIAAGKAEAYYRFGATYEWDTCAMQAVAECAGGVFLQGDLSPMYYNREDPFNGKGFIIANRGENVWTI